MKKHLVFPLVTAVTCYSAVPALADYTLVLKNGRRITVQSYREEGSMVKIHGLGGEFGIPKDQIQTILKAGQTQEPGLSISDLEASTRPSSAPAQKPAPTSSRDVAQPSSQGETKPAVNDAEEKEYQKRLAEVTQKLEAAKHDYFKATQGGGPSSSATKDGYRALTADLMSRLKDRRGASPSEYEPQEKELSDLRNQIDRLEKERDALIQEMQNKNYRTGSF